MIDLCFVVTSNSDIISHHRSFDGGDYILDVTSQCDVYVNNASELTDSEIVDIRKFVNKFNDSYTVEATFTNVGWYDDVRVLYKEECNQLLSLLNKESQRFEIVQSYQSLRKVNLMTKKEVEAEDRKSRKEKMDLYYKVEIGGRKRELELKIEELKNEYSNIIDKLEKEHKQRLYEFYRREIVEFEYQGNTIIEEFNKFLLEIALELDDNDFIGFYLKKYSSELFGSYLLINLPPRRFEILMYRVLDKAKKLIENNTYIEVVDYFLGYCNHVHSELSNKEEDIAKLNYLRIDYTIRNHDLCLLKDILKKIELQYQDYIYIESRRRYMAIPLAIVDALQENYNYHFEEMPSDYYLNRYPFMILDKSQRSYFGDYNEELNEVFRWWLNLNTQFYR